MLLFISIFEVPRKHSHPSSSHSLAITDEQIVDIVSNRESIESQKCSKDFALVCNPECVLPNLACFHERSRRIRRHRTDSVCYVITYQKQAFACVSPLWSPTEAAERGQAVRGPKVCSGRATWGFRRARCRPGRGVCDVTMAGYLDYRATTRFTAARPGTLRPAHCHTNVCSWYWTS